MREKNRRRNKSLEIKVPAAGQFRIPVEFLHSSFSAAGVCVCVRASVSKPSSASICPCILYPLKPEDPGQQRLTPSACVTVTGRSPTSETSR